MEYASNDRSLHFIVRHPNYRQTAGYPAFLNYVLVRLNSERPASARQLLERTAALMLNQEGDSLPEDLGTLRKNISVFADCLDESTKTHHGITPEALHDPVVLHTCFGPAAEADFGLFSSERLKEDERQFRAGKSKQRYYGCPIVTEIVTGIASPEASRAYFDTLAENYPPLQMNAIPGDFLLEFAYPVPDGHGEMLQLMKVGTPQRLKEEFSSRFTGDSDAIRKSVVALFLGEDCIAHDPATGEEQKIPVPDEKKLQLAFLHPHCNEAYFGKLVRCIDPLLAVLDAPQEINEKELQHKEEAMITIYWLLAQSTPPIRGGSAYANIMLEHMAERLRGQGYMYDIPYTKAGVDLWAQATTLPLERFKQRFRGELFDKATTRADMQHYMSQALQKNDEIAPETLIELDTAGMDLTPDGEWLGF